MTNLNFDAILLPGNLNYETYNRLILMLNEDHTWKRLADYFEIFSECDIQKLMSDRRPAEKFLFELGTRLCTIEIFCDALEKCRLINILMLFKDYSPIQIIDQTALTENSNPHMVGRGQQFTLHVKAVGIPPPKYQWFHDSLELNGKTDSSLTLQNFNLDCEGEYFCVIHQEGYDTLVSNSVALVLAPEPPVIIKQPASQKICSTGSKVTLFVEAEGHPKLNYQWHKGNERLNGCTGPNLTIEVNEGSEKSKYQCRIYNEAGEIWSDESTIRICTTPHPEPSVKLALLISNQLYDNLNILYTPENDVKTLSDLLKDLGFLVIALQNLNLVEMKNAVRTFANLLPSDAYVVFYFAGHGFEIHDKFMLPIDSPGPDSYLQSNGFCERELLKAILSSKPKLFLELLDMCLKPPNPSNKKIFQETTDMHEYEANNNLIQAYSTTSYLGAYEKKTGKNGLYVEYLKKYLTKDKDLPILEILQRVAKDFATICMKQKPFFGTNITMDYRLSDPCKPDSLARERFRELSSKPEDFSLKFKEAGVESTVRFSPYLGVFLNTLEIHFTNLKNFRVTCEALGTELTFELFRDGDNLLINVMNLQKLVADKTLNLILAKNENLVDRAVLVIGKPMIAVADLWKDF